MIKVFGGWRTVGSQMGKGQVEVLGFSGWLGHLHPRGMGPGVLLYWRLGKYPKPQPHPTLSPAADIPPEQNSLRDCGFLPMNLRRPDSHGRSWAERLGEELRAEREGGQP